MATFELFRGDTCVLDLLVTLGGTPEDLTDADLIFVVKNDFNDDDDDALIVKSSGPGTPMGLTITDPTMGVAQIVIDPADTADDLNVRHEAIYQLRIRRSSGDVFTIDEGTFIISPVVNEDGTF